MDTPESDVSAIQSGTMEPLPLYVENEGSLTRTQALVAALNITNCNRSYPYDAVILYSFVEAQSSPPPIEVDAKSTPPSAASLPEPIMEFPGRSFGGPQLDDMTRVKQSIVSSFFNAIEKGDGQAVTMFVVNRLVSANTTDANGKTPLLAAVRTRDLQLVKLLIDLGADADAYGIESRPFSIECVSLTTPNSTYTYRTPLQLAASIGNLPLVKFFFEIQHCDDASVAPDGQIALRLAAANGHRDIVDYLPARRGGGFRRWQHQHAIAIRRTKKAAKKIVRFGKFVLWDVEKFFLWSVPKHAIVMPVVKSCRWCWERRALFGPWCVHQACAMPARIRRAAVWLWECVKEVLEGLWKAARELPRGLWFLFTRDIPRLVKRVAIWTWKVLTETIPKAIAIVAKWLWSGISTAARAIFNVLLRILSFFHTVLVAVGTFFRSLTLRDVLNGLTAVLRAVFVAFPQKLWSWLRSFSDMSYAFLKAALGTAGEVLWYVIYGLGYLAMYLPRKIWVIVSSLGGSVANAWWEVLVFVRPKA